MTAPAGWTDECERIAQRAAYRGRLFIVGAEADDVAQEARLGVWRSLRSYDPAVGMPWPAFAELCARRMIVSAIVAANREKHRALSTATSLALPIADGATLADVLPAHGPDPLEQLLVADDLRRLVAGFDELSDLERRAVVGVILEGRTYDELGNRKAVDNALQRGRRKLADAITEPAGPRRRRRRRRRRATAELAA